MPSGLFWPTRVVEAPKGTGKDGTDGNPGRLERNERQGLGACRARTHRHDPARRGRAREPHRGHGQEIRVGEIPDPTLEEDAGDARTLSRRTQAVAAIVERHRGEERATLSFSRVSDLPDWIKAETSAKRHAAAVREAAVLLEAAGVAVDYTYMPEGTK